LFLRAIREWHRNNPVVLAASLSYFTAFSMVPLLMIALAFAGRIFESVRAREELFGDIANWFSPQVSASLQSLLGASDQFTVSTTFISVVFLAWASLRVFTQIQDALNLVWDAHEPRGLRKWSKSRFRAFLMIGLFSLVVVFFVSLDVGYALVKDSIWRLMPGRLMPLITALTGKLFSVALFTVLFAFLYKVLPERRIAWRDVWVGAFVSSVLFALIRWLLSMYFAHSLTFSLYGAAGSVLILLIWIYCGMHILLFGAAFARAYSQLPRRHRHVVELEKPI
jgi:membrane protein